MNPPKSNHAWSDVCSGSLRGVKPREGREGRFPRYTDGPWKRVTDRKRKCFEKTRPGMMKMEQKVATAWGILAVYVGVALGGTWRGETSAFHADARAGRGMREPCAAEWVTWDTAWDGAANVEVTLERPDGSTERVGGGTAAVEGRGSAMWRPGAGESGKFTLMHVSRDASGREIGRMTAEFFLNLAAVATSGSPVPVPFAWLEAYPGFLSSFGGDYEAAAVGQAANGLTGWECYVAGVAPTDTDARLKTLMEIRNGELSLKPDPDLNEGGTKSERVYNVQGRKSLDGGTWEEAPGLDGWRGKDWQFFRISVKMPD